MILEAILTDSFSLPISCCRLQQMLGQSSVVIIIRNFMAIREKWMRRGNR